MRKLIETVQKIEEAVNWPNDVTKKQVVTQLRELGWNIKVVSKIEDYKDSINIYMNSDIDTLEKGDLKKMTGHPKFENLSVDKNQFIITFNK